MVPIENNSELCLNAQIIRNDSEKKMQGISNLLVFRIVKSKKPSYSLKNNPERKNIEAFETLRADKRICCLV